MIRFLGFLVSLLIVVLIVVAFVRGWVDVSMFNNEDTSHSGATISVDKAKVKDDVAAFENKLHSSSQGTTPKKEEVKVQGTVTRVGPDEVVLATDSDRALDLHVAQETRIRVGAQDGTLKDLHPGDPVTATYLTVDNKHVATSLQKGQR